MKEWKPKLTFNENYFGFHPTFPQLPNQSGYQLSTIYKKHANFKFLIGLALDKEQLEKNPYDKLQIKKITKAQKNDILTEEEFKILQQAYDNNKYKEGKKEVFRDFLFSCYTSLSYAEFHNFTYVDLKPVRLTVKKKELTSIVMQRTSKNERNA